MRRQWVLREADERQAAGLSEGLKISPLLARLLVRRGYNEPEAARRFLSSTLRDDLPSPFLMRDLDKAADRLVSALKSGELICVWGDYDVDGTTGTAALISFLKEIGAKPVYHVPHRIEEGYGLNAEGLERLGSQGVRLVVTVDCGVSNHREVETARSLGMDIVVVDHHQPPEELPQAVAVVNPHRRDCPFPDKGLSAAGLAFYLIIAFRARLREIGWFEGSKIPDIRRYLDIVTLGTIADMVPLREVNRTLARRGLQELGASQRPGVLALRQVAGTTSGKMGVGEVAFRLGPRINAAGRVDAAMKVVDLLTTDSRETAERIAGELDEHNRERQAVEAQVLEEALSKIDEAAAQRYSIVVGQEGWHPGVLGIVASRIVERFHRPTFVIGFQDGLGKGSGRSIRGFHLVEGLRQCADLLEKFGGHEYAGGLSIKEEKFSSFVDRFEEVSRARLTPEELIPILEVDAQLDFAEISLRLLREIEALQPFGIGNPEPLFMTPAVEVSERRDFSGGCRLRLRQKGRSLGAVGFGLGEDFPGLPGASIDLVYRLSENVWEGLSAVELRIVDARISSST